MEERNRVYMRVCACSGWRKGAEFIYVCCVRVLRVMDGGRGQSLYMCVVEGGRVYICVLCACNGWRKGAEFIYVCGVCACGWRKEAEFKYTYKLRLFFHLLHTYIYKLYALPPSAKRTHIYTLCPFLILCINTYVYDKCIQYYIYIYIYILYIYYIYIYIIYI
jgi:hypothetical protein